MMMRLSGLQWASILSAIGYICGMVYAALITHDSGVFLTCLAALITTLGLPSPFRMATHPVPSNPRMPLEP